jgi:hypothetical protein
MAPHPLVCEPPLISSVKLSQISLSPPEVVIGVKHFPLCSQCKSEIDESNTNRWSVQKTGQKETSINPSLLTGQIEESPYREA